MKLIKPLQNRVALITGASRGLGKDIALTLAEAGATIIVNYNKSADQAQQVVKEIEASGGKAYALQADVSNPDSINSFYEQVTQVVDSVDILVNNAGINPVKTLEEVTLKDFQQALDTNLTSAFLMTQLVIPGMIKNQFGRIINLSSVAAQLGGVIGPHYAASKAGLLGLTHSYAALLAKHQNITANAIAPALIETDMIKDNPNIKPTLIPLGRFGQAEEVSSVVLLLATNGYINGQTFNVNGGWYMS